MSKRSRTTAVSISALMLAGFGSVVFAAGAEAAWQPTKPVEFIIPAGTGGGADQMARVMQGIITKHNLQSSRLSSSTNLAEPAVKDFSTSRIRRATIIS